MDLKGKNNIIASPKASFPSKKRVACIYVNVYGVVLAKIRGRLCFSPPSLLCTTMLLSLYGGGTLRITRTVRVQ